MRNLSCLAPDVKAAPTAMLLSEQKGVFPLLGGCLLVFGWWFLDVFGAFWCFLVVFIFLCFLFFLFLETA